MKRLLQICIFTSFLITINTSCHSQQMMHTINDAQNLKINERQFINKPLEILLKEIKPEIKMVSANPSTNNNVRLGYLIFRFEGVDKYDSSRVKEKYPLQITVFVKEPFEWDIKSRPTKEKFSWTKEDEKKYGKLTVVGIRVYGEN